MDRNVQNFNSLTSKCNLKMYQKKMSLRKNRNSWCPNMNLVVQTWRLEEMLGFKFESSNALLEYCSVVCALPHFSVSTPRVGPVPCKRAIQTLYRGRPREQRTFEGLKMSVVNTKLTLTALHPRLGVTIFFPLGNVILSVSHSNII